MTKFTTADVEPTTYLYVERTCPMVPDEIGQAMGGAFAEVMRFLVRHGIRPVGPPMSVYHTYDPDKVTFRAGFPVAPDAARAAEGSVKCDATPSGRVARFTHVGPYATLAEAYGALTDWLQAEGLEMAAPAWESYLDDPADVPGERLRTEVWVALG